MLEKAPPPPAHAFLNLNEQLRLIITLTFSSFVLFLKEEEAKVVVAGEMLFTRTYNHTLYVVALVVDK